MRPEEFAKVFPLGTHLCREPMPPMAELKRDMETLKRHGFNLVKLQEHWAVDEPQEGHYDFSRYEELIEYAGKLDLGVYLGLTCEQAPAWLWRKHPSCRMVGRSGTPLSYEAQTTLPGDGKPGPCFDHAGAREDMVRFIRKLVQCLGRFPNLAVWNTWQEISYWAEGIAGDSVCFCPHTLAFFRDWLHEVYGDLDQLNRAWNTRYLSWEDVQPDRGLSRSSLTQVVAWRTFMDHVQIGRVLTTRARAIREADPLHRPVFAHKGGPIIGSGMDWTYARCQDFMGSSCYPAWGAFNGWDDGHVGKERRHDEHEALKAEMCDPVALRYDYIRCANVRGAPVWAAEFQGGPVSTGFHKGRVPRPEDLRRWMLTAVSSGVTAISFWVTRAEIMAAESNGFSLLDSASETSPRFLEAARVGTALNRHADVFGQPNLAPAAVGVVIDENNYQLCAALSQSGAHQTYSVRGWHRLLWDSGIPQDFVEVRELGEPYLRQYRALVLPFPLSLSEKVAGQLARYVEQGGNLVTEAAPGRINEYAYCNRGELSPAMATLCGVQHQSFTMVREPNDGTRWSPGERTWGEYLEPAMLKGVGPLAGNELRANVYIETFACTDGEPLLRYGDAVAGAVRQSGQGRAWLLGTYCGHSGTAYRDEATTAALRKLLALCGVTPAHDGQLLLRRRVGKDKEAWLFTNPGREPVTEEINVSGWRSVSDLFGVPLKQRGKKVALTVAPLDVAVLIVSK